MAIIKQYDKRRNVTYFYESHSQWIPELGQPRAKRKLIGKLDPETGQMVPTGRRGRAKSGVSNASTSETKSPEARLCEENSKMREELMHAKQEIEDLTQTVRKLKSKNKSLSTSILRMSSMITQLNEVITDACSQASSVKE